MTALIQMVLLFQGVFMIAITTKNVKTNVWNCSKSDNKIVPVKYVLPLSWLMFMTQEFIFELYLE